MGAATLLAALAPSCAARDLPCASDRDCARPTACDLGRCVDPAHAVVTDLRPRRVALAPVADTTVLSADCCRSTVLGGHDAILVGGGPGGGAYRSYLRFDLSELGGGEVARAELRLRARPARSAGTEALEVLVLAAGGDWSPRTLTWATQPGGAGAPVATAVVRPADAALTVIDVTRLVAAWTSGAAPNRGAVLLARRERSLARIAWASAEALDPEARPALEVDLR